MKSEYILALKKICHALKDKGIDWALTGSLNLALQGVDLKPNDIDIITDEDGAYRIQEILSEYVIEDVRYSEDKKFKSHFGKMEINGIEVEIMGDLESKDVDEKCNNEFKPDRSKEQIKYIKEKGLKIPVISLEYEEKSYQKLGRLEKARKIEKFLNK